MTQYRGALHSRRSREATWSQPPRFCGAGEQSQPGCFFQEKEGEVRTQHGERRGSADRKE